MSGEEDRLGCVVYLDTIAAREASRTPHNWSRWADAGYSEIPAESEVYRGAGARFDRMRIDKLMSVRRALKELSTLWTAKASANRSAALHIGKNFDEHSTVLLQLEHAEASWMQGEARVLRGRLEKAAEEFESAVRTAHLHLRASELSLAQQAVGLPNSSERAVDSWASVGADSPDVSNTGPTDYTRTDERNARAVTSALMKTREYDNPKGLFAAVATNAGVTPATIIAWAKKWPEVYTGREDKYVPRIVRAIEERANDILAEKKRGEVDSYNPH